MPLLVASISFGLVHWQSVWAALPGTVGAPELTSPVEVRSEGEQPVVRLAVVGDVGTGEADEIAIAELVARLGRTDPFDGLVLLGDNVYPNGDPARLDATVFDPFAEVLDAGARLLPVLGNHDVQDGNGPGQVEGLGMPGRWYATEIGPVLFVGLDSTLVDDAGQLEWLNATLEGSSAEFILVAMHHPAFSAGYHGSESSVQESWVPILEQHHVDLVLAGHDHDYQRSVPIGGVTYVVSGGGAKLRPTGRSDFTAYSASVLHFVDVGIWNDRIELRAISQDGMFDEFTIWSSDATELPANEAPANEATDPSVEADVADDARVTVPPSNGTEPPPIGDQTDIDAQTRGFELDDDGRIASFVAVGGLTIWALAVLAGWVAPIIEAAKLERVVSVGSTTGMLVTVIALGVALIQILT